MSYVRLMDYYKVQLRDAVRRGDISKRTMITRLNHANRVFEACLCAVSPQSLEALTAQWFGPSFAGLDKRGYLRVILDLRNLVEVEDRYTQEEEQA